MCLHGSRVVSISAGEEKVWRWPIWGGGQYRCVCKKVGPICPQRGPFFMGLGVGPPVCILQQVISLSDLLFYTKKKKGVTIVSALWVIVRSK